MCAVATCSTRSGRDKGVCMFRFPKDSKLKQTWFIKCRRKNYIVNEHSRVCEKHFDDSDFVVSRAFAASLGYNMNFRLQLKPDAVPVTIPEPKSKIPPSSKRKQPPKSMTWEKRRRLEVKYFSSYRWNMLWLYVWIEYTFNYLCLLFVSYNACITLWCVCIYVMHWYVFIWIRTDDALENAKLVSPSINCDWFTCRHLCGL